jgi:small subunit ribosomal protein S16
MLVIRMQRTGRKGHAMFRVVVQDSRRTPTSGKVVAALGSYDPHAKNVILNKDKAAFYLEHGAQPSPRVAGLLKAEGVKLPEWVKLSAGKKGEVRHADKRRSTAPAPEVEEAPPAEEPATEPETPAEPEEAPVVEDTAVEEAPAPEETTEEPVAEAATTEAEPETSTDEATPETTTP